MTRLESPHLARCLEAWEANLTLPLQVHRAKYDVPFPRSWEVLASETATCDMPIAEFTEWSEAQAWANDMARWAAELGAEVRRHKYGYWPSGKWGGIGFFDITGIYHELPDPEDSA